MDDIKQLLIKLISISDNIHRTELYERFYNAMLSATIGIDKDLLNKMYTNFSGLLAHSELSKNEYNVLKLLLQYLEKILV